MCYLIKKITNEQSTAVIKSFFATRDNGQSKRPKSELVCIFYIHGLLLSQLVGHHSAPTNKDKARGTLKGSEIKTGFKQSY